MRTIPCWQSKYKLQYYAEWKKAHVDVAKLAGLPRWLSIIVHTYQVKEKILSAIASVVRAGSKRTANKCQFHESWTVLHSFWQMPLNGLVMVVHRQPPQVRTLRRPHRWQQPILLKNQQPMVNLLLKISAAVKSIKIAKDCQLMSSLKDVPLVLLRNHMVTSFFIWYRVS